MKNQSDFEILMSPTTNLLCKKINILDKKSFIILNYLKELNKKSLSSNEKR